jgi:LCP family protein required for cell wall assembly
VSSPSPHLDEGRFGPPVSGGRERDGGWDWRRVGVLTGAVLGVGVLLLGISALVAIWYGVASIDRVDVDLAEPGAAGPGAAVDTDGDGVPDRPEGPATAEIEELTEILNVLVVGSDSREGLTQEQLLELGTEADDGNRTDTIMLLQLDPRREQVSLLSFPRDLLVTRCDGTEGRINAAVAIGEETGVGGGTCLVRTITEFTGIPINHYIQVDLVGFIDVVEALGGVSLYLDEPIRDVAAGADFDAGCVTMDGLEALTFVRARQIDNDFGRIARQQRFIREVVRESSSLGTLANPARLFSLVDAGARAVETDRALSVRELQRIAFSLRDLEPERLDTRTVPTTSQRIDGAALEVADEDDAEALFTAFREATVAPDGLGRDESGRDESGRDGPRTDEPRTIDVEDVPPITVLNGAGRAGLAATATDALEAQGLTVASTGNAEDFGSAGTRIVHAPDQLEEAELLAGALGGAELREGGDGEPLTVVLGSDYDPDAEVDLEGAVAVGATAAPATPAPNPSPQFAGADAEGSC